MRRLRLTAIFIIYIIVSNKVITRPSGQRACDKGPRCVVGLAVMLSLPGIAQLVLRIFLPIVADPPQGRANQFLCSGHTIIGISHLDIIRALRHLGIGGICRRIRIAGNPIHGIVHGAGLIQDQNNVCWDYLLYCRRRHLACGIGFQLDRISTVVFQLGRLIQHQIVQWIGIRSGRRRIPAAHIRSRSGRQNAQRHHQRQRRRQQPCAHLPFCSHVPSSFPLD